MVTATATLDPHGLDGQAAHPHDTVAGVPQRLPIEVVRAHSVLRPAVALRDVGLEWLGVAAAVALYVALPNPLALVVAVVFIGARQHALTVLGHDAAHFRLHKDRFWNDALGDLLMQWPMFISVSGFRHFHGQHHKHTGVEGDGNRFLWRTHDKDGQIRPVWVYPKTRAQLVAKLVRRGAGLMGVQWILRGVIGMFVVRFSWGQVLGRLSFYAAVGVALHHFGWWTEFLLLWILPLVTWHQVVQHMRLIVEHNVVDSDDPGFRLTRTTVPTWWERLLILPRNIGYHIEHHWYPSVPYYNLPALHAALMAQPRYREGAVVSDSIFKSLKQVTRAQPEGAR